MFKALDSRISVVAQHADCPRCGRECARHSVGTRRVRDTNRTIHMALSKHWCEQCRRHFSVGDESLAPKRSQYSRAIREAALALLRSGKTLQYVSAKHRIPPATLSDWRRNSA